jgi:hypothetical protein
LRAAGPSKRPSEQSQFPAGIFSIAIARRLIEPSEELSKEAALCIHHACRLRSINDDWINNGTERRWPKFFLHDVKNRLADPSEIYALHSKK